MVTQSRGLTVSPGHGNSCEGHGRRGGDGLLGLDDLHRGRGQRPAALIEHVAHLVRPGSAGARSETLSFPTRWLARCAPSFAPERWSPVTRVDRSPSHGELRAESRSPGRDGLRGRFRFYSGLRFGFRLNNGLAFDGRRLRHGGAQLVTFSAGTKIPPVFSAMQASCSCSSRERSKPITCAVKAPAVRAARPAHTDQLAGLHPVRHQYHRCRIIPVRGIRRPVRPRRSAACAPAA